MCGWITRDQVDEAKEGRWDEKRKGEWEGGRQAGTSAEAHRCGEAGGGAARPSGVWVALATLRQAGTLARWLMVWRQRSAVFWMRLGGCLVVGVEWGAGGEGVAL